MTRADAALKLAEQALRERPDASFQNRKEDTLSFLQASTEDGISYGMLSYNVRRNVWVVRGEGGMLDLCERLFPETVHEKRGEVSIANHARTVGDLNWMMLRYPLQIRERDRIRWQEALTGSRNYYRQREQLRNHMEPTEPPEGSFLGTLMPFQKTGLTWLLGTPRALLADEMGLGKTVQALCALCAAGTFPAILVVPPHLVRNWQAEINRFIRLNGKTPRVHEIRGLKPYELPEAEVYIIHYLLLRGWKEILPYLGFKAAVFDEVQ